MPSTWHKRVVFLIQVVLLNTCALLYFHLPDTVSQKAEVNSPGGAFRGGGQSSEEQRSSRKDNFNTWKSPARNTAVQKPACSTHVRGRSGLVVGETRHAASPVWALQLIPVYPSIVYSSWESVFHSRGHTQPWEVTRSTRTGRYADFSTEKLLKPTTNTLFLFFMRDVFKHIIHYAARLILCWCLIYLIINQE